MSVESQKYTAYLAIRYYGFKIMLDLTSSDNERQHLIRDTYSSKPFQCDQAPDIKWQLDLFPFGSQGRNSTDEKMIFTVKQLFLSPLGTEDNNGSSPIVSAEVWVRLKNSEGEKVNVGFEKMEGNVYVFSIDQSIVEASLHPNGSLFVECVVEYALPSTQEP
ncbi:hypothetical protein DdX_09154 [Ditylenchus destructor]|uniref:MATH domain-containing protein n=1 Tax=Ditylenchus destructor TaxID=166010 RepID=A0AAD4N0U2_9BILA|nr:hypothetical protein DdX_09154 [Ditylenchus destructor]